MRAVNAQEKFNSFEGRNRSDREIREFEEGGGGYRKRRHVNKNLTARNNEHEHHI